MTAVRRARTKVGPPATARDELGNSELPGQAHEAIARRKSPVGRSPPTRVMGSAGGNPWLVACGSEAGGLACIVRPHSQSRALLVSVMIGIRVMVQSLFRFSGYLGSDFGMLAVACLDGLDRILGLGG